MRISSAAPGLPFHSHAAQAAGFTVSPLMSKYVRAAGGEGSQESLVTLVLKADLGGLASGARARGIQGSGACREGWRAADGSSLHFTTLTSTEPERGSWD